MKNPKIRIPLEKRTIYISLFFKRITQNVLSFYIRLYNSIHFNVYFEIN